ncbi:SDR family NAD(P)-dependent oxidoreductase [Marinobacterium rhizophilum]|uniref:SDR family NAD(P)-dependent oxidoreductase n=1 Tax=Marinobacterium rhizophilum TaxID=420402 RepID=A0ABY5HK42_9GAMM|nr:SDR family NAD(P)-dependent oxidoreductase [Marinobacterium rhizophilum]UTW12750.1 SDR family NAD(P)-dependent oxidoreductase [Marinobacterium rhizophilum]
MQKTLLITGSTDGIGLEAAKLLASQGHRVLLHGRSQNKLDAAAQVLAAVPGAGPVECYLADLSKLADVDRLARTLAQKHQRLDCLINNAGIFRTRDTRTEDGLDVRFAVNTIAPYLLTRRLLPLLDESGRVVNLSSAAQAPVELDMLSGARTIADDFAAYAQSKLALTMWSRSLALSLSTVGPAIIAVNPGSMLGSKMVKEGFGVDGGDLGKGARILARLALEDEFSAASGLYFDNDIGRLAPPHRDALDPQKSEAVVRCIERVLADLAIDCSPG